ncbi:hypothetical protein ACP3W1_25225, partial [Salmonella enterica]|uniref:hypothetical protein n=1 Tax=Salmonella enterica TaxID=28901 RepID=UPI003CF3B4E3
MEACKSEQEGLKREKEEQLYASLEGLKVELNAYRNRASALDGEDPLPVIQPGSINEPAPHTAGSFVGHEAPAGVS